VAALLDKQSIVATSPGIEQRELIGAAFTSFEALGAAFYQASQDRAVWRAPSGKVSRPKVVGWSVAKPSATLAAGATSAAVNTGLVKFFLNSSAVDEMRIQGASQHMVTSPSGWADMVGGMDPANGEGSFMGGGIVITSSDSVSVRVTPASATQTLWRCTIWGTLSGALVINKANFLSYATTADQIALTYTPPSNFSLIGYCVNANQIGSVSGFHVCDFNGVQGADFGYMGMADGCTQPMPDATYGAGAQWINTWGMKFYPSEQIGFRIGKNDSDSSEWHQFVMGDDVALTEGAGGGNTYSRGRVVNR